MQYKAICAIEDAPDVLIYISIKEEVEINNLAPKIQDSNDL